MQIKEGKGERKKF